MTPIQEIYYQFDNQNDQFDFYIWLHQNRKRIMEEEKNKKESLTKSLKSNISSKLSLRRKILYIERYNSI